jgi:hypothetical protein
MAPDDPAIEQFARQQGAAVLTAPLALAALNTAIHTVLKKEYA